MSCSEIVACAQLGVAEHVADQHPGEGRATGPDEGDLRCGLSSYIRTTVSRLRTTITFRSGSCKRPLRQPSRRSPTWPGCHLPLADYAPASELRARAHRVERPRFPVDRLPRPPRALARPRRATGSPPTSPAAATTPGRSSVEALPRAAATALDRRLDQPRRRLGRGARGEPRPLRPRPPEPLSAPSASSTGRSPPRATTSPTRWWRVLRRSAGGGRPRAEGLEDARARVSRRCRRAAAARRRARRAGLRRRRRARPAGAHSHRRSTRLLRPGRRSQRAPRGAPRAIRSGRSRARAFPATSA